jgi:hypothetical protein
MPRRWKTPRPRRRTLRRLGIPERIAGVPRHPLQRAIRRVSLVRLNQAESENVASAIAHRTDLKFIDTLESIAAQLDGVGGEIEMELGLDEGEVGADESDRISIHDPPVAEHSGGLQAVAEPEAEPEPESESEVESESDPDLELEDDALDLEEDDDEFELDVDDELDLDLDPDEQATLPGVPPPQPPSDIEGTTEVVHVLSDEELLAGAAQLSPEHSKGAFQLGPVAAEEIEPERMAAPPEPEPESEEVSFPPMPQPDPDEGITEIFQIPPPEEEVEPVVEGNIAQLGPAPAATGMDAPTEQVIALEEDPAVATSLQEPPDDEPQPVVEDSTWEGAGLDSWDGHSLDEYMGLPADSSPALESWDGHSLEEYLGKRAPDGADGMASWDGHSLEEYLGKKAPEGEDGMASWDGHSLDEYLGRRTSDPEDALASWDGHSLEEYLGAPRPDAPAGVQRPRAFTHPPAFTHDDVADAGGVRDLPPTADPDDPADEVDEVDDYLLGDEVGDSELDLEAVAGEGAESSLDDELDEVLDLESEGEIEAVALSGSEVDPGPSSELERMGLPPVPSEAELDSADPDTIVAIDEPPPAAEPSVDYLHVAESPAPVPELAAPGGDRESSDGQLPEWLAEGEGAEDRGETTGSEVDLSMSLESIPESARLSQLDDAVEGDDDLSGDLELDLEVDDEPQTDEPPTPARGARRPTDQVPTVQEPGTGGGPQRDGGG